MSILSHIWPFLALGGVFGVVLAVTGLSRANRRMNDIAEYYDMEV